MYYIPRTKKVLVMSMGFARVHAENMSDVVEEVECNVAPPDSPTN
jgi:hypothetical protein